MMPPPAAVAADRPTADHGNALDVLFDRTDEVPGPVLSNRTSNGLLWSVVGRSAVTAARVGVIGRPA